MSALFEIHPLIFFFFEKTCLYSRKCLLTATPDTFRANDNGGY